MIKQHDFDTWPKDFYVAIASLKCGVSELEQKCKLKFRTSEDDLDSFRVALLEIDNEIFFMLMRYEQSSDTGVEIWVAVNKVDVHGALEEILSELGLTQAFIDWKNPHYLE